MEICRGTDEKRPGGRWGRGAVVNIIIIFELYQIPSMRLQKERAHLSAKKTLNFAFKVGLP
jgi:hypothetical protein